MTRRSFLALVALALAPLAGPGSPAVAGPKTMRIGTNVAPPTAGQPVNPFANSARRMSGWYSPFNQPFTTDEAGYVTDMTGSRFLTALVLDPGDVPGGDGRGYAIAPADGIWSILWRGEDAVTVGPATADGTLYGTPTTATTADGSTLLSVRVTAAPARNAPSMMLSIHGPDVRDLRIYRPGISPANPPLFDPEFVRMARPYRVIRYMDGLGTNSSNVTQPGHFSQPGQLSYGSQRTMLMGGEVASIAPYADPTGLFHPSQGIPVLVTTGTPHGLSDGQQVTFSGLVGPHNNGTFDVTGPADVMSIGPAAPNIWVLSPTTFTFARGADNTRYVAGQALATTYAGGALGPSPAVSCFVRYGWTLADAIALCNLIGADLWLNVPHGATDACVSAMFAQVARELDPGLKVYCEWSNETWNWAVGVQAAYCIGRGFQQSPKLDGNQYHVKRSGEAFVLAATALGPRAGDLVRVLATQAGWPGGTGRVRVDAADAQHVQWDMLAPAPYFWCGPIDPTLDAIFDAIEKTPAAPDLFMDLVDSSIRDGSIAATMAGNAALLTGHPGKSLGCYEGGPDYLGFAGTVNLARRSRRCVRHPRFRGDFFAYLQTLQDSGCSLLMDYQLFGVFAPSGPNGSVQGAAAWSVNTAWNQRPGLGDGSDGLFDNRTDYESAAVVSVIQGAIESWNTLAGRPPRGPAAGKGAAK